MNRRHPPAPFIICIAALCAWLIAISPLGMRLELVWLDLHYPIAHWIKGKSADAAPVIVIGLDETAQDQLKEPLALWHPHIGKLLEALAAAAPLVVGFDINLPQHSFDFLLPGNDQTLARGLLAARAAKLPVVLGVTQTQEGEQQPIYPLFVQLAGEQSQGVVLVKLDVDNRIRRFTEQLAEPAAGSAALTAVPTLAGQMARVLNRPVVPGLIDYSHGKPFNYIPITTVLHLYAEGKHRELQGLFAGKLVLVGAVLAYVDRQPVPYDKFYAPKRLTAEAGGDRFENIPGVFIHAQALRSLVDGRIITPYNHSALLAGLAVIGALLGWIGQQFWARALLFLSVCAVGFGLSLVCFLNAWFAPFGVLLQSTLFALLGRTVLDLWVSARERRRLRDSFGGTVSGPVLQAMLEGRLTPELGGEERELCALFSDIRGFTARSQTTDARQIVALLNRYFERMAEVIAKHGGNVDKFIGDGIMAFFGTPLPLANPCDSAYRAAIEMLHELDRLNEELAAEGEAPLHIGIGLHFGSAVVGNVGSKKRYNYTAIGDTINLASRVETLTKEMCCALLMTDSVWRNIVDQTSITPLGTQPIKGHSAVSIYGHHHPARATQEHP